MTSARSSKGAAGMWQLMPETAVRFGIWRGDHDGRTDPVRSTRVAARYLRLLYDHFGDWNLAMASYNAGEAKVEKAIRRAGTRDFWRLAELGELPRETRNYVPAVLAAKRLGESSGSLGILPSGDRNEPGGNLLFAPFALSSTTAEPAGGSNQEF
jgi:membrane-bound lytic murein transglycosylase D